MCLQVTLPKERTSAMMSDLMEYDVLSDDEDMDASESV